MSCKSRGFVLEIRWNVVSLIFIRFGAAAPAGLAMLCVLCLFALCRPCAGPCAEQYFLLARSPIGFHWFPLILVSGDFNWFPMISVDFRWLSSAYVCWFPLISDDFCCLPLLSIAFRCFPMLPGAFRWSPLTASDVRRIQLIIRCPLISIDVD